MLFRVTLDGVITGALDDEVRRALDLAMAEMFKLGVYDPSIYLDSTDGRIAISCAIEVADFEDAVPPASVKIRTALHSAEIGTPRWPEKHHPQWTVEFIKTQTEKMIGLEPVAAIA
jgi:hypothetical protein